ncbi:MAG: non-ribosomal peptide synthetase, partial [Candidatus Aminicenantes bacterium]
TNYRFSIRSFCGGFRGAVFSKSAPLAAGGKIYMTGDLARWLPDGTIEFLGREDTQVKIRGIRIELGEIEGLLAGYKEIKEAVVIDRENESGEKYLCAYFVADRDIPVSQLRKYLSVKLPDYMIPAYFIQMGGLPLSSHGKVERKSLPLPGESRPALEAAYAAPRSHLERTIANIWKGVLNLDKVGVHDNYFDLGGNSLSIVKVNNKLKIEIGRDIPLVKMFRYPTIDSLARYINQETGKPIFDENIKESVNEMEETMQMFIGEEDE